MSLTVTHTACGPWSEVERQSLARAWERCKTNAEFLVRTALPCYRARRVAEAEEKWADRLDRLYLNTMMPEGEYRTYGEMADSYFIGLEISLPQ